MRTGVSGISLCYDSESDLWGDCSTACRRSQPASQDSSNERAIRPLTSGEVLELTNREAVMFTWDYPDTESDESSDHDSHLTIDVSLSEAQRESTKLPHSTSLLKAS